jgi:hypothetical protein
MVKMKEDDPMKLTMAKVAALKQEEAEREKIDPAFAAEQEAQRVVVAGMVAEQKAKTQQRFKQQKQEQKQKQKPKHKQQHKQQEQHRQEQNPYVPGPAAALLKRANAGDTSVFEEVMAGMADNDPYKPLMAGKADDDPMKLTFAKVAAKKQEEAERELTDPAFKAEQDQRRARVAALVAARSAPKAVPVKEEEGGHGAADAAEGSAAALLKRLTAGDTSAIEELMARMAENDTYKPLMVKMADDDPKKLNMAKVAARKLEEAERELTDPAFKAEQDQRRVRTAALVAERAAERKRKAEIAKDLMDGC